MNLEEIRNEIDKIDDKILTLLNKRYECVKEVGKWKQSRSHEIYVPEREKKLLSRLESLNTGPLKTKVLRAIYREIMSGALALEHPLTIAYSGNKTSLAKYAALGKFGKNVRCASYNSLHSVFSDVANERVDYGIVPIENTREGIFSKTLDEFISAEVSICAEINVCFHSDLLTTSKHIGDIENLYAPSETFNDCSVWLKNNMDHVKKIIVVNQEEAVNTVLNSKNSAMLGNQVFSSINNLHSLVRNIENNPDNITRFLIIGKQHAKPTGDDKTTLCYIVNNESGALCETLLPFRENNITATMFASRPVQNCKWEYSFFIDYTGHSQDENFQEALLSLKSKCTTFKILGSYPKSDDIL